MYLRISQDRSGLSTAPERQREDCLKLAEAHGWTIVEEYIDRDRSAWTDSERRRRPSPRERYEAMLEDIQSGNFDAIVCYHQSRLSRSPAEFEEFLQICSRSGVKKFRTVTGHTDLDNDDSVMIARIFAAVASNQSATSSRLLRRKNEEKAALGLPHISGMRPYGYELDRMTVRESEAKVIRVIAERFIAGESLFSLATWLGANEIRTATGTNSWRTPTLRNLLKSPRIAGLREHRGEVVGAAAWPAIITLEQHEQIKHRLRLSASRSERSPRRYLLSGRVFCGLCGAKMFSSPDAGRRRYGCRNGPDFAGCGRIFINADPLEALIVEAVLTRLDGPDLSRAMDNTGSIDDEVLTHRISELDARLTELVEDWHRGDISKAEWLYARKLVEKDLSAARKQLARLDGTTAADEWAGRGQELAAMWGGPGMSLYRQVAIVGAILDRVVIHPAARSGNRMDPGRVKPVWIR